MQLRGVQVKKIIWQPEKRNSDNQVTEEPKVVLTLEISDPASSEVKSLIDFAQKGWCMWTVESLQAEMAPAGAR